MARRRLVAAGLAALLAACGGGGTEPVTPPGGDPVVTAVSFATDSVRVAGVGTSVTVRATASGPSGPLTTATLTWTIDDTTVARVVGSGLTATVTAVDGGTAILTARSGTVTATVPITVPFPPPTVPSLRWSTLRGRPSVGVAAGALVVLHEQDTVVVSSDTGTTWRRLAIPHALQPRWAVHTGTRFVLLGRFGGHITSTDGVTWTPVTATAGIEQWISVTRIGPRIIASGLTLSGPPETWYSDDGVTWRRGGVDETTFQWMVPAGPLVYAGFSARVFVSADSARTWTQLTDVRPFMRGVPTAFWDGTRVLLWDGSALQSSTDGITWSERTTVISGTGVPAGTRPIVRQVLRVGDRFLAALEWPGVDDGGSIVESRDGVTWTQLAWREYPVQGFVPLTGALMAVGGGASWSRDGVAWEHRLFDDRARVKVWWSGDRYFMVSGFEDYLRESRDGVAWREFALPQGTGLRAVAGAVWNGTRYVVVAAAGRIITSPDGVTWTTQPSVTTEDYEQVLSVSGFTLARTNRRIVNSFDGTDWGGGTSVLGTLTSLIWDGRGFVGMQQTGAGARSLGSLGGRSWGFGTTTIGLTAGTLVARDPLVIHLGGTEVHTRDVDGVWTRRGTVDPASPVPDARTLVVFGAQLLACGRVGTTSFPLIVSMDARRWASVPSPNGRNQCGQVASNGAAVLYVDADGEAYVGRP